MAISLADVHHIAVLARLGLSDARAASVATELSTILAHMVVLATVDTDGVPEATGSGVVELPLRPDVGPPISMMRPLMSFAPSMRDGLLLVPRLSSHESAE